MNEKPQTTIAPAVRAGIAVGPTHGERRALAHLKEIPRFGGNRPFARNADKWRDGLIHDIRARTAELDSPASTADMPHAERDDNAMAQFRDMIEAPPSAAKSRDR